MPRKKRMSHPGIMFKIRPKRSKEVLSGGVKRAEGTVVLSTKTVCCWRRDYLRLSRLKPRNAGDRKLAFPHQYPTHSFRNEVFARYGRYTRAQVFHVALLEAGRRRQRSEAKCSGFFVPLPTHSGEATQFRSLAQSAWTRTVQNSFPFSLCFTHTCPSKTKLPPQNPSDCVVFPNQSPAGDYIIKSSVGSLLDLRRRRIPSPQVFYHREFALAANVPNDLSHRSNGFSCGCPQRAASRRWSWSFTYCWSLWWCADRLGDSKLHSDRRRCGGGSYGGVVSGRSPWNCVVQHLPCHEECQWGGDHRVGDSGNGESGPRVCLLSGRNSGNVNEHCAGCEDSGATGRGSSGH